MDLARLGFARGEDWALVAGPAAFVAALELQTDAGRALLLDA